MVNYIDKFTNEEKCYIENKESLFVGDVNFIVIKRENCYEVKTANVL